MVRILTVATGARHPAADALGELQECSLPRAPPFSSANGSDAADGGSLQCCRLVRSRQSFPAHSYLESEESRCWAQFGLTCTCLTSFGRRRWNLNLISGQQVRDWNSSPGRLARKFIGACSNGDVDRSSRGRAAHKQVHSSVIAGLGTKTHLGLRIPRSRCEGCSNSLHHRSWGCQARALCILAKNSWVKAPESGSVTEERRPR